MCYPDSDYYITSLFEQLEDFNASGQSKPPQTHDVLNRMQTPT